MRRGIGLFIMRMGVWRCPLEDRQEHHSTLFCITTKSQIGNGGDIKNKMLKKLFLLLVLPLAFAVTSCSNDDDEPSSDNLAGTKWEVMSTSDDDVEAGLTIEFKKDGNCVCTPSEWDYAQWSVNNGKLKIVLGENGPDDYMEGVFTISDKTATYTYSWYDYYGDWGGEDTYTMTLKKK